MTIAALLMALISLANLLSLWLPGAQDIPAVVIYGATVLGVVGLVGVVGLWLLRKWGLWLTSIVLVFYILSWAPRLAFAPSSGAHTLGAIGVLVPAIIIALLVGWWR